LKRFNKEHGVSLSISPRAMEALTACEFPGNVRELESCVRRTAALTKNPVLQAEDFELSSKSGPAAMGKSMSRARISSKGAMDLPALEPNGRERATAEPGNAEPDRGPSGDGDFSERERLVDAMERAGWVQAKAARLLGLTPRQMGYALRKQGIEIKRF
jgi:Nif-specific regulatory protein